MSKRNNTVVIYIQIRDSELDFSRLTGNKFSRPPNPSPILTHRGGRNLRPPVRLLNFLRFFLSLLAGPSLFSADEIFQGRKNDHRALRTGFEIFRERLRSLVSANAEIASFFQEKKGEEFI